MTRKKEVAYEWNVLRWTGAFVLSFNLALWAEYLKLGVRVAALCPGPTATNFFTILGSDEVPMIDRMHTPETVVMTGLRALERGRPYAVEGRRNAFGAQLTHMAPLALMARVFARAMRPRKRLPLGIAVCVVAPERVSSLTLISCGGARIPIAESK